jgi:multisubunit Na+/H+ antiporter MnhB subunit
MDYKIWVFGYFFVGAIVASVSFWIYPENMCKSFWNREIKHMLENEMTSAVILRITFWFMIIVVIIVACIISLFESLVIQIKKLNKLNQFLYQKLIQGKRE